MSDQKDTIPLSSFVESAGSQEAAGRLLGCTQVTVGKAIKRGDVFIQMQGDAVVDAYSKKAFPDTRMRKTPSAS